jgi:uracil-DNA glycosylase
MKPILLVGEARGQNEDRLKSSFVGAAGAELIKMLGDAHVLTLSSSDRENLGAYYRTGRGENLENIWVRHADTVRRTNVFNLHPHGDDLRNFCGDKINAISGWPKHPSGWIRDEFYPELDRLGDEILALDPNLIICLGNTPLWALTGRTGISKLRGTTCVSTHCVSGYKLLCALHPAGVMRQWETRPVTVLDLYKALREREFPEVRRPNVEIWIEPSLEDIERFTNDHIVGCTLCAADVETVGTRVTCISFAPRKDLAIVIPFDDERRSGGSYWPTPEDEGAAWRLTRRILEDPEIPKLFQNGLYDIAFLWRSYGIKVFGAKEDTMLLSHALQPESLKGLAFLGSVYTDHGPWKSERKGNETIGRDK